MRNTRFLFYLITIVLILGGLVVGWKVTTLPANSKDKTQQDFLIVKGQGVGQVALKLKNQGLIKSDLAFKVYAKITGKDKKIQAGEFRISPSLSLVQVVSALVSGPTEFWVTYPEGLRREEIAIRTIKTLNIGQDEAKVFWKEFIAASFEKEGYLYPDTYLFSQNTKALTVVEKLYSTFNSKVTPQMKEDAKKAGLTLDQVVVLASLVERETRTDEDRPVVGGILLKRIGAGWPLQIDATLQYFTATQRCKDANVPLDCEWWKPPVAADKEIKSSYNTYLNQGLPPGPISNPGISSIKAVIYPKESMYWFYLHDGKGIIHYAETMDAHDENIRKYIR